MSTVVRTSVQVTGNLLWCSGVLRELGYTAFVVYPVLKLLSIAGTPSTGHTCRWCNGLRNIHKHKVQIQSPHRVPHRVPTRIPEHSTTDLPMSVSYFISVHLLLLWENKFLYTSPQVVVLTSHVIYLPIYLWFEYFIIEWGTSLCTHT